jgi:hypothetical protein
MPILPLKLSTTKPISVADIKIGIAAETLVDTKSIIRSSHPHLNPILQLPRQKVLEINSSPVIYDFKNDRQWKNANNKRHISNSDLLPLDKVKRGLSLQTNQNQAYACEDIIQKPLTSSTYNTYSISQLNNTYSFASDIKTTCQRLLKYIYVESSHFHLELNQSYKNFLVSYRIQVFKAYYSTKQVTLFEQLQIINLLWSHYTNNSHKFNTPLILVSTLDQIFHSSTDWNNLQKAAFADILRKFWNHYLIDKNKGPAKNMNMAGIIADSMHPFSDTVKSITPLISDSRHINNENELKNKHEITRYNFFSQTDVEWNKTVIQLYKSQSVQHNKIRINQLEQYLKNLNQALSKYIQKTNLTHQQSFIINKLLTMISSDREKISQDFRLGLYINHLYHHSSLNSLQKLALLQVIRNFR